MNRLQIATLVIGLLLFGGGVAVLFANVAGTSGFGLDHHDRPGAREEQAYVKLREADEYLRQNSREAARSASVIFNRVLARNVSPRINELAAYGLAVSLEKLDDRAAAIEYYRELKQRGVTDPVLRDRVDYSLGKLLLYIDHEEEGSALLKPLLAKTQDRVLKSKIHEAFGNFALARGQRQRAEANFRIAVKYDPENLAAERGRAAALKGQGRAWEAYKHYDDYLVTNGNLDPKDSKRLRGELEGDVYERGLSAYRAKRYHDAIGYLNRALRNSDSLNRSEKTLFWLGESYAAAGKSKEAIRCYDRVLKNADSGFDQAALVKKGILLEKSGRLAEAGAVFQRAIEDYPGGAYTGRAQEWREEVLAQLREKAVIENLELDRLQKSRARTNDITAAGDAEAAPATAKDLP
ncbi:MAG: tetratricopeptide repeat protein [bacterium]|nr:tetratricopeptide repeat protein [bacterium]